MTTLLDKLNELTGQAILTCAAVATRQKLQRVPGLDMQTPLAGEYAVGSRKGEVRVMMRDLLRVRFGASAKVAAQAALETTHLLPGNVRLATGDGWRIVQADVRVEDEDDLNRVFAVHKVGFRHALRGRASKHRLPIPPSHSEVEAALAGTKFDGEAIVRHDDRWQFHPLVAGQPTAVEAKLDDESLRLWRVLLPKLPGDEAQASIADQALRLNARVRQCRLASTGSHVVVEARLHAGWVTPAALDAAVRAVAVVDRHCRSTLELLAQRPEVAKVYREVLLDGSCSS